MKLASSVVSQRQLNQSGSHRPNLRKILYVIAKSSEEKYECEDMIVYGSDEAMRWLDEHQKEGEVIYATQLCNRDSFQYGNACSPVVVLTPRYQSENACKKFAMEAAETDIKLQFGNNDHHCKSRSGRNQPWIEVASYNLRVSK